MQFRFLTLATAATLAAAGSTGLRERDLQNQPSAKFAATWETTPVVAAQCIGETDESIWAVEGPTAANSLAAFCGNATMATPDLVLDQAAPLGKIKIPQNKEILITLSSQINLFTLNTATSKKGGKDETTGEQDYYGNIGATSAMAGVSVYLEAVPESGGDTVMCAPGSVIMASRYVELRNRIGGNATYVDCIDELEENCVTKIADLELESSIGIAMDTTAAHSFQWVCTDMESDVYNVKAHFTLEAAANNLCDSSAGGDCTTIGVTDLAAARVILGKRMLTVQEVRAVKDSIEALEI